MPGFYRRGPEAPSSAGTGCPASHWPSRGRPRRRPASRRVPRTRASRPETRADLVGDAAQPVRAIRLAEERELLRVGGTGEARHGKADQPDGLGSRNLGEGGPHPPEDLAAVRGGRLPGPSTGERVEVREPELERDGAAAEPGRAELGRHPIRLGKERRPEQADVPRVAPERLLRADGLRIVPRDHGALVDPLGQLEEVRAGGRPQPGLEPPPTQPRPGRRSCGPRGRRAPPPPPGPRPRAGGAADGRRKAASSPGLTSTSPSGFSRSEAIFATNLFGATPADAVSPTSSRIRALIRRAISTPVPWRAREPVTSRNASSRDRGSTSGVKSARIAMIRSDSRAYFSMSTGRKAAVGHRR